MGKIYSNRWTTKNGNRPNDLWIAQIGSMTSDQITSVCNGCIARCASGNSWPPDLADFVLIATECRVNPFGLNVDDVMAEYKRWRNESYRYSGSEKFPWRHPVLYHICIEMRRAGVERRMTAGELERLAERLLTKWVKTVNNGMSIPPIRRQLAAPKHPAGPTPAQLMYEEYLRKKAEGLI
ncbi:replication protein P [Brenneria goodwinii]|uniref:replication protein P n=1 Tax=Brenneria goodwinii TaxID=1109412 RepID=UPI001E4888EA|nr:replication protein P [Brenneria goodwinii]